MKNKVLSKIKLNHHLTKLKSFYGKILEYKIALIIYLLVIIAIIIVTVKNHRKQKIEHFADREFKNKYYQYSQCKKKCVVKYDNPDQAKACKKHCKCKKNCITDKNPKKCLKGCKELKLNIYRDDENKYQKEKLKQEIKQQDKIAKKKEKIKAKKEELEKEKEAAKQKTGNRTAGFLVNIMNKYSSEKDRMFLLDLSSSTSRFYKDVRNVFRVK